MDTEKFARQLELHEGRRRKPYKDTVGKITIGVGRNLTDRGLSDDEIDYLLANDIATHVAELRAALPWFDTLDDVRQRVLADMAINLGVPGLLKFRNTLKAVANGKYEVAADHMLKSQPWATQVGQRARRLAEMMRSGKDYRE